MPRLPRPDEPGGWHHVMNRGADRQDIFGSGADFARFESLLAETVDEHHIEVHAYCLMTNHFHLLLHCPDGGLSHAMQAIQRQYTQWYNSIYQRDGALYRGRFRSVNIEDDRQLTTVGRYIHRNAIVLVPARSLSAYRWSSFGVYCARRSAPPWLTTTRLEADFAGSSAEYRAFVEQELPSDDPVAPGVSVSFASLMEAVSAAFGDPDTAQRAGRGVSNPARLTAIALAVELRVDGTEELARHFGLRNPGSVRTLARRGRVAIAADPGMAAGRRRVLDMLYGELLRGA